MQLSAGECETHIFFPARHRAWPFQHPQSDISEKPESLLPVVQVRQAASRVKRNLHRPPHGEHLWSAECVRQRAAAHQLCHQDVGLALRAGAQELRGRQRRRGSVGLGRAGDRHSCSWIKAGDPQMGQARACTAQGWCTRRRISISPLKSPSAISLEPLRILAATSVPYLRGTTRN